MKSCSHGKGINPIGGFLSKRKIDPVEGPDPIRIVVPVEGVDLSHEGN